MVALWYVGVVFVKQKNEQNVCCADGLGGGISPVFEVLGGFPDGTVRAELAHCLEKLQACGISERNAVFVQAANDLNKARKECNAILQEILKMTNLMNMECQSP